MAQATLSPASVIQAKTDVVRGGPVSLGFDGSCQAGSTVTIELSTEGVAFIDFAPGLGGNVPDGFELDSCTLSTASVIKYLYCFRKSGVAAGEQTWSFNSLTAPLDWVYRATEWNAKLEPISPLEGYDSNFYAEVTTPNPPATLSTGTAPTTGATNRQNVVALAWHLFFSSNAGTFAFSNLTNGFTERAALSSVLATPPGAIKYWPTWSWLFADTAGQFECTATCARTGAASGDNYASLVTVYAATTAIYV